MYTRPPPPKAGRTTFDVCQTLCAILISVTALCAPLFAFTVVSCTSTRACGLGLLLQSIGATCQGGTRPEGMAHGDKCQIQCPAGLVPSTPELVCDDGDVQGEKNLACSAPVVYKAAPIAAGVSDGAVRSGEVRTACARAANLPCTAPLGGASILLQLGGPDYRLSERACDDLMEECRALNGNFEWGQFTEGEGGGTCTMGCFNEILDQANLEREDKLRLERYEQALAEQAAGANFFVPPAGSKLPTCSEGPMCLHVTGSCNEGDNGDYYRFPVCASRQTQWVKLDRKRRIRYDGKPQYSQAGKWLIEKITDPLGQDYGIWTARQPNFGMAPLLDNSSWDMKCTKEINAFTTQITYARLKVSLGNCSCTDEYDCNSNGRSRGDKETGPNCRCFCNETWTGDNCETPLCKAPRVLNARSPACREGWYFKPGEICTPDCAENFAPNVPSFLCNETMEPASLDPTVFECRRQQSAVGGEDTENALPPVTGILPRCTNADCSFRGTATGWRLDNGNGPCECECDADWEGTTCRSPVTRCKAPSYQLIDNSATLTCKEGINVREPQCTGMCQVGYYAAPATLACRGEELDPPVFRCFGGKETKVVWCEMMQYLALATYGITLPALVLGCYFYSQVTPFRTTEAFEKNNTLVEIDKDEETDQTWKVIRNAGLPRNGMPKAVRERGAGLVQQMPAIGWADPGDLPESRRDSRESLRDAGRSSHGSALSLPGAAALEDADEPHPGRGAYQVEPVLGSEHNDVMLAVNTMAATQERPPADDTPVFKADQLACMCGFLGHTALNGAYCTLVEFDSLNDAWVVRLEGTDELKQVPEKNLQLVGLSTDAENQEGSKDQNTQWLMELREIELNVLRAQKDKEERAQRESAREQREAEHREATALQAALVERAECDKALREGLRTGDADGLKATCARTRTLLEKLGDQKSSERMGIQRLLQTAESRLEQYDTREAGRQSKREAVERVVRGDAPDWNMTPEVFWRHVENATLEKVRAGIKAMQPLTTRSKDGKRLTILHIAARGLVRDAGDEELTARRLATIKALIEGRANANAIDASDKTPVDLAVYEGGPGAADSPVLAALRELGMVDSRGAAEEIRRESAANSSAATSPKAGASSAASPTGRRSSGVASPVSPARSRMGSTSP